MDLKQIKAIISLMENSNLSEFEIEDKDLKLRIKRGPESDPAIVAVPQVTAPVASPPVSATSSAQESAEEEEDGVTVVKSPMVGTFYRASSPDNPPFVESGQKLNKGVVLCIIEAMKVMNEIKAEVSGTISQICVEEASPVQYGDALFRVT